MLKLQKNWQRQTNQNFYWYSKCIIDGSHLVDDIDFFFSCERIACMKNHLFLVCVVSCHMIMWLFFYWLHNKIVWVVEGINSESVKIQDTQIKELYSERSWRCMWYSASGWCSCFFLESFGEINDSAPWPMHSYAQMGFEVLKDGSKSQWTRQGY